MDADDLDPVRKAAGLRNLDPMSIEELGDYIAELDAEIGRVKQAITRKQAVKLAPEAFFKR